MYLRQESCALEIGYIPIYADTCCNLEGTEKERKKKILEKRSEFLTFPEPFTQGKVVCKGRPALSVLRTD